MVKQQGQHKIASVVWFPSRLSRETKHTLLFHPSSIFLVSVWVVEIRNPVFFYALRNDFDGTIAFFIFVLLLFI